MPSLAAPVAVVDCGTNSTRLLVRAGSVALERRLVTTRLGRDLGRTGRLDEEGVRRTLVALAEYRDLIEAHGARRMRAIATQAVREASDGGEFVARATDVLGFPVDVLAGSEEGRLGYMGATSEFDEALGPFLVLDIGGGSTELSIGTTEFAGAISFPIGSVRLTEQQLHSDPPAPEELSNAISLVDAHLDDVLREMPAVRDAATLLGTGGTITTVAAVEIGLLEYDRDALHRFVLTRPAAEEVFRTLATERLADRVHNPGLQRDRADIIVGGCCVLLAVMRRLEMKECIVSETDLLDGVADELAATPPAPG
ncbi:MAG TPA: Ppx/GppA phosphatase family protein [Acidimicrobiales bacterium]|nr:Ppx/GppA phosphatase family protein [Acidimicrobiales bacterium]